MFRLIATLLCVAASVSAQQSANQTTSILKVAPAPEKITSIADYASCKVYQTPEGKPFSVAMGRIVKAEGNCPPTYVQGKQIDAEHIEIARHDTGAETGKRICLLTPQGNCKGFYMLDNPSVPSTTLISAVADLQSDLVQPERGNHVLYIDKARGTINLQPGDWSTCKLFRVPDGTNFLFRGKAVAAEGRCPPHAFVPGKLIGTNEVQVGGKICVLSPKGNCTSLRKADGPSLPREMPETGHW